MHSDNGSSCFQATPHHHNQSGAVYSVINGNQLQAVDIAKDAAVNLAEVDDVDGMAATDGHLVLSLGPDGVVNGYDVARRRVTWTLTGLPGVRDPSIDGERVTFVVPATGEIRTVDLLTGKTLCPPGSPAHRAQRPRPAKRRTSARAIDPR